MSRIGNRKLVVPEGVTVTVDNNVVTVKGPKGELSTTIDSKDVTVEVNENEVVVKRSNDEIKTRSMHGTVNANINNMMLPKAMKKNLKLSVLDIVLL